MAKEYNEFHDGKIYKITSPDTDLIYIGSTTQTLKKRLKGHKDNYNSYLKQKHSYTTAFELIKLPTYTISLIELAPVETRKELYRIEGIHVKNTANAINDVVPGRTKKEYCEDNKEHISEQKKEYREKNIDKLTEYAAKYRVENSDSIKKYSETHKEEKSEYNKKYREDNNETILAYEKQYRTEHAEERNAAHKKYYEENKAKIALQRSQKIDCPCGDTYTPGHKTSHERTAKHKNKLLTIAVQV